MYLFFSDSIDDLKALILVLVVTVLPVIGAGWVIYSFAFKKQNSFSITDVDDSKK